MTAGPDASAPGEGHDTVFGIKFKPRAPIARARIVLRLGSLVMEALMP